MTRPEPLPEPPSAEEDAAIIEFLRRNPDFFVRHSELLEELPIRHGSGGAVSLIERQVRLLRHKNEALGQRLEELLATARENETRVQGMNRLAESLIRADSLASVVAGLNESLQRDFNVEAVRLALFDGEAPELDGVTSLATEGEPGELDDFFRQGRIWCGELSEALHARLFAEHPELASVALVPLDRARPLGLIALASTDPRRFTPDMGSLFLDMTANLCAAALRFHAVAQR